MDLIYYNRVSVLEYIVAIRTAVRIATMYYGLRFEQVHTAMRTPKYKSDRMTSSEPVGLL